MRLLMVDDEQEFLELMHNRLERRGFMLKTCANGKDALELISGNDFDLAVVDMKMPDMGGLELLSRFKELKPDMPVLLLTGHGSMEANNASLEKGAAGYLLKPVSITDLIAKIESIGKK